MSPDDADAPAAEDKEAVNLDDVNAEVVEGAEERQFASVVEEEK